MTKIEFHYFEGCPSYIETAKNLKDAMEDIGVKANFKMIEVINPEDAIAKKFLGSPTIRVNGMDIEHKDGNYVFGCRVYSIDGKILGTPTKEFIQGHLISIIKHCNKEHSRKKAI